MYLPTIGFAPVDDSVYLEAAIPAVAFVPVAYLPASLPVPAGFLSIPQFPV